MPELKEDSVHAGKSIRFSHTENEPSPLHKAK